MVSPAAAAAGTSIAGSIAGSLVRELLTVVKGWLVSYYVTEILMPNLREQYSPKEVIPRIVPKEKKEDVRTWLGDEEKLKKVSDFVEGVRDFNMEMAKLVLSALPLGPIGTYAIVQAVSTIQWSFGIGWLSWIGTSEIVSRLIQKPTRKFLNRQLRDKELTRDQVEKLYAIGELKEKDVTEFFRDEGYPEKFIPGLKKLIAHELSSGFMQRLLHAGVISEKDLIDKFVKMGWSEAEATALVKTFYKYPSVSFLRKVIKANPEFKDVAKLILIRQGYSEPFAELLLADIKEEKVEEDKKLAKSDILKAFRYGLINEDEAVQYLMDLGYDEAEANLLVKLEKKRIALKNVDRGRDLSKSDVLNAFKYDVIKEEEARELLKRLGYDDVEINILLDIVKKRKQKKPKERRRELTKSDILRAFREGIISEEDARKYLAQLGYKEEEIDVLIKLGMPPPERVRRLTLSQLIRAFEAGIIDEKTFMNYLDVLGYGDFEKNVIRRLVG